MRPTVRRVSTLAVLGAVALASGLPAAAQSGTARSITHRQSILTELSPTGEPGTSRVFTQLTATGDGPVTIELPQQSTSGLRSLEGFGGPEVDGDRVVHTLDPSGPDGDRARTVADNTAELPVSVSVIYRLDGQEVDPSDLAGEDGDVEVEYTVRNLTAQPQDVVSFDAENNRVVETMDVAVPMVGTLSLTLPPSFANISAPGAVTAGDGRGNTVVNFSLLLFAPLGSEEQVVSWSAQSVDTTIPETSVQVLPVDDRSFGSLTATADAYKGATESLTTLANGALIINSNLQLLASGAGDLLDGLGQLADGAGQLSDGLANTAAPGARQLADGMSRARAGGGELSSGLGELALGATRLSDGLGTARAGSGELQSGLGELALGATRLSVGLGDARAGGSRLAGGLQDLSAGTVALRAGTAQLTPGLQQLAGGAQQLAAGSPTLATGAGALADGISQIAAGAAGFPAAAAGLDQIAGGLASVDAALPRLIEAVGRIRAGVGNIPGCNPASPATNPCGVLDGLDALEAGLTSLRGALDTQIIPLLNTPGCNPLGGDDPADCGAAQLAAGAATASTQVRDGIGGAIGGLTPLESHPDPVVAGTVAAVNDGLEQAQAGADGARQLADGASQKAAGAAGALTAGGPVGQGIAQLQGGVDSLQDGITRVDPGDPTSPTFNPGLRQALTLVLGGLTNPACDLANPTNPAEPCGLDQVIGDLLLPGAEQLDAQLGPALLLLAGAFGTTDAPGELTAGALALAAGAAQLDAGLQQLAPGAVAAAEGAAAIDAGAAQLAAGAGLAANGSQELLAGLRQLDDGGQQLAAGAGRAATGSGALVDGLRQLDDGGQQLAAGANRASTGSRDLADGLVQLDDGATRLADGLGDAADGSTRLSDGLNQAEEGGGRLADGTNRLQEGFESQLIGGVSAGRQGASLDYEQVRAVIARGREGAAPYGIAVGADEATTVFQFDLAGVGREEGPSTPLLVGLAILALAVAGGLGLALRRNLA